MRRFLAPVALVLLAACSNGAPVASRDSRFANHEATSPAIGQADQSIDEAVVEPTTIETTTTTIEAPPTTATTEAPARTAPIPTTTVSRPPSTRPAPVVAAPASSSGGGLDCGGSLPSCSTMANESRGPGYPNGGDPTAVNETGCGGRGCYGKWQFDPLTSASLGYDKTMDQYPVDVQDQAARDLKAIQPCAWGC
jgi:hypothetical protein